MVTAIACVRSDIFLTFVLLRFGILTIEVSFIIFAGRFGFGVTGVGEAAEVGLAPLNEIVSEGGILKFFSELLWLHQIVL